MRNSPYVVPSIAAAFVLIGVLPSMAKSVLPACDGDRRPAGVPSCIATGDRGWKDGSKWRLKDTEAPEIIRRKAECRAEQVMGLRTRDRLRMLMSEGYTIFYTGREDSDGWPLATIKLTDGRDASSQLMSEGMIQAVPNNTNRWCDPEK